MTITLLDAPGNIDSRLEPIDFTSDQPIVSITAEFWPETGTGPRESIYDGTDANHENGTFSHLYRLSSRDGNTWSIVRENGWPAGVPFELRIKEAAVAPPSGTPTLYAPIAQWPLDGAPSTPKLWFDRSGNGRALTAGVAAAAVDMVEGRTAAAPVFASRLTRAVDPGLQLTGALTLTMRVRWTSGFAVLACMSAPFAGGIPNRSLYVLQIETNGRLTSYLDIVPNNITEAALEPNVWHFVSLRRAADLTEVLGIDGTYESFPSRGPISGGSDAYLVLGDQEEAGDAHLIGAMADVTLWDKRLTDEQLEHVRRVSMGLP